MSTHAFFAPSAAHRWVNCPGSMAFPQNQVQGDSSKFADDGTASHTWAAECLKSGRDAAELIGQSLALNGRTYTMDEDRAGYVQVYLDDVRMRVGDGHLLVEHHVPIPAFGEGQGGTADACIIIPEKRHLIIEDLKYGVGEKVCAQDNEQGLSYLLGSLPDAQMLTDDIDTFTFVVCQPRLGHIDEWTCDWPTLKAFAARAAAAIQRAGEAMVSAPSSHQYLQPGEKTCRWCRGKAVCPALAQYVAAQTRSDFEAIAAEPPAPPTDPKALSRAAIALPLIQTWVRGVQAELWRAVSAGEQVVGSDGQPMKIIEGEDGKRQWRDPQQAEEVLMLHLPPEKLYKPREIITAPQAGKLLDKKATKETWKVIAETCVERKKGRPKLVLGSEPGTPYTAAADAAEFDEIGDLDA